MYGETIDHFAEVAQSKRNYLKSDPIAFFMSAAMAGAYVGVGVLLALSIASSLQPEFRPLVMGSFFGIALILVVFSGGELFTGYVMYLTFALIRKAVTTSEATKMLALVWLGNLFGAAVLAGLFVAGGGGGLLEEHKPVLLSYAAHKLGLPIMQMLARGVLCNWLVCLAIWTAARLNGDSAKIVVVAWCLCAFVACGFEHSVANMTAYSIALIEFGGAAVPLASVAMSLALVTLGNLIGGSLLVGGAYALASRVKADIAGRHDCGTLPVLKSTGISLGRQQPAQPH